MTDNKDEKTTIIMVVPLVWCYRNFIISGICRELEKQYKIYYAIPEIAVSSFIKQGVLRNHLLILEPAKTGGLQTYLFRVLKRSFAKRYPVNTANIFKKMAKKADTKSLLKEWVAYTFPASLFSSNRLFSFLEKTENHLYLAKYSGLRATIQNIAPSYLLSTTNVVPDEWPFFRVCQSLGIKTFSHILSFDNLTSRGYLPIGKFDTYFVWNQPMADELTKYYDVHPSKIKITGTPQFDYHIDGKYLLDRKNTLSQLGFKEDDKYILYCANHFNISPGEPELLDFIFSLFQKNPDLAAYNIVLRLHPMDKYERWDALLKKHSNITLSLPWPHQENISVYWGEPTLSDLILFSNTLRYCSLMLNIASTVSIDAAITNTPTVCVGFHPTNKTESGFYREVHFSEHYAPIMDTNATPLAVSADDLIKQVCEQLIMPGKYEKQRSALKERFLPATIISSSEKITGLLKNG